MAKRKSKQIQLDMSYGKQRMRLIKAIQRLEKRGYIVDENAIPNRPKRVTQKSVERLEKIKTKDLYEKAIYVDKETGEVIPGTHRRYDERKEWTRKGQETRARNKKRQTQYTPQTDTYYPSFSEIVISNYKAHIRQFNDLAYTKLEQWLNGLIAKFDIDDVAQMLQEGAENGNIVTYQIVYSQDKLTQYIAEMINYLPDVGDIMKEDIVEAFETMEDWESPQ